MKLAKKTCIFLGIFLAPVAITAALLFFACRTADNEDANIPLIGDISCAHAIFAPIIDRYKQLELDWGYIIPIDEARSHIITQRIHPNMPEFTFIHTPSFCEQSETYAEWGGNFISLTIKNETGAVIQQINDINIHINYTDSTVEFYDYNFDGYLDMRLLQYNHGLGFAWEEYYFWLWDTETSAFVRNDRLKEITSTSLHSVDHENRQILINRHRRAGAHHLTHYYEYVGGGDFKRVAEYEVEVFRDSRRGGHFRGMLRTIHTDLKTGDKTVQMQSNAHPLDDLENEKIIQLIDKRVQGASGRLENSAVRSWVGNAWIFEQPRWMAYDSYVEFRDFTQDGARIKRTGILEYFPEIKGGVSFSLFYNEEGELIFAKIFQYNHPSYQIYFHEDAVILLVQGNDRIELASEFCELMIHAIALSLESAYR